MIAKEAGIEPLADALWGNPRASTPKIEAQAFLKPADAVEGATISQRWVRFCDGVRDIL
jgi:transcriptional accessory protein Tex/SPT6